METNVNAFNNALGRFFENFQGSIPEVLRSHGEDFVAATKEKAPVDTGRFKNSIHMVPPGASGDAYTYQNNPVDKHGKPIPVNTYNGSLTGIPTGKNVVTVGTNVHYAIFLEAGHSRQAPHGIFAITLLEKTDVLNEALIDAAFKAMMED